MPGQPLPQPRPIMLPQPPQPNEEVNSGNNIFSLNKKPSSIQKTKKIMQLN